MRVRVYFNLHKKMWSVMHKGKVIQHTNSIELCNARFIVHPSGRARVLQEKRKNVHAFVEGDVAETSSVCKQEVKYNPYKFGHFFRASDEQPVYEAENVFLISGKVFADDIKSRSR